METNTTRFTQEIVAYLSRLSSVEQFARDLLVRLSRDYGDDIDCPAGVLALFARGDQLFPLYTKHDCSPDAHVDSVAIERRVEQSERHISELYDLVSALRDTLRSV